MTEVTIAHGTTAEEMAAWTREYETKIPQIKKGLVPHVMMGGGAQVDIVNGQPVVKHHFEGTAMATPGLRPGHVVIGGIETTIEGAIASGLMTPEEASKGFQQPAQSVDKSGIAAGEPQPEKTEELSEEAQAAKEASDTLNALDEAIGAAAVDAALAEAVDSGYLPDEDELPEGVDMAQVLKVSMGYVAQANSTLGKVGASVPMLMELCSDEELRDARQATVHNSGERLEEIGRAAVERLASLPTRDPEEFAERLEGMSAAERKVLRKTANGEWTVAVPGYPEMGFGAAVRAGLVRV